MLLKDFIADSICGLESLYGKAEGRSIVLMLTEEILGTKSYTHIIEPQTDISPEKLPELTEKFRRLTEGEPIQYVLGYGNFCGRQFKVGPGVLIPRPETEIMTLKALGGATGVRRALDLYTGSGCIAWTVALELPGVEVIGLDNSPKALQYARHQDFTAEMERIGALAPHFVEADLLTPDILYDGGQFDMIISNPPYIMPREKVHIRQNVLGFEPHSALFAPEEDPLVHYRAVAEISARALSPSGMGYAEINSLLAEETMSVFHNQGFEIVFEGSVERQGIRYFSYRKPAV